MENKITIMTRVLSVSHAKVCHFAIDFQKDIPDAYDMLIDAGIRSLGYKLPEK